MKSTPRKILGTIGATLAIGALMATSAAPAGASCGPCVMDGGTGTELLFNTVVLEVDADGLGDETQDPDGGGLDSDWEDDWFEDYGEFDALDENFGSAHIRSLAAEVDVSGDKSLLVTADPAASAQPPPEQGGKQIPIGDGRDQNDLPRSSALLTSVHDGDQILVTAEPDGGSPEPTSDPVLSASMT